MKMLSVVIPALNSASTISYTLKSIFSNNFPKELFEVIVVDNGSSDETVEIARKYPVKIFYCPKRGIGPPRNLGIRKAKGEIICLTDSDCIVEKNWLAKIYTFFKENPEADGVGGPVFPYPHYQTKIQKLTGELFVEDQGYPKKLKEVEFGSTKGIIFGSNSAYKKETLITAGGYSEPEGSNLELAWRLVLKGRKLFFSPHIKVYHIFPTDIPSIFKQQFRWGFQSTYMKRIYRIDKGIAELIYILYFPFRRLLSLFYPKDLEKKLLHFIQLTSYNLGRIYGFSR
ncbi:glycosyltransferase [Candidatus Bathyarchaeota archaeon]|nr:glycosyltransferase [Candidatus Bathyarchaeota archaeon]